MIRTSVILFYVRIFPAKLNDRLGRILLGTLVFNVFYNVAFFFVVIFQCTPVHLFWTGWEGHVDQAGHCGNANVLVWVRPLPAFCLTFGYWRSRSPSCWG